ncbi:MAG: SDR family NAD(P)-dependent oxidoreductase [Gammaproteobacteria bacterium]|nr:SDR family NAD(P)-dependent oxidoreductase [Gammaproteobacteria bacterium]
MKDGISRRAVLGGGAAAAVIIGTPLLMRANALDYKPAVTGRPAPGRSAFGRDSTAEEVTAGMDLSGRTALVTGCNSGLGLETMRVLAMRGAHVIGAARTGEKAETACASVEGKTTPLIVELTDLPGIVTAAAQVAAMDTPIDMLVLNAGIMALQELRTANGVEMQFAVNHLGHFLLANRLLEQVVAADAGRVVVVSSRAHGWAPTEGIQFDNLDGSRGYDPWQAYGQSKVANGLFSRELARRLADTNATSNSLHPGVIDTNLSRHLPPRDPDADTSHLKSIPQGTATQCYVATSPDLDRVTGYYFSDCNPAEPKATMQDDDMAAKLWAVSEELVADYL